MQVLVNPDGTRNRSYRPYISQEESTRSVALYNPDKPRHYGLYDSTQPYCTSWQAEFQRKHPPLGPAVVPIGNLNNTYVYVSRETMFPNG